eukprot:TRINITY_DN35002_c0_g1_i1.p1 TRINITY_DN35002_c0_g1~~TRINITY_DN35002_c0_g1_i1.p1  ORF type:complete len:317 (+),score=34.12 TRINITY_DN35002_c0_g1_i1:2-952(+)
MYFGYQDKSFELVSLRVRSALTADIIQDLSVPSSHLVSDVKLQLRGSCDASMFRQRLLIGGDVMEDNAPICSYAPPEKCVLEVDLGILDYVDDKSMADEMIGAARHGNHDAVISYLSEPLCPDVADNGGRTPLWMAAAMGHYSVVSALCTAKADLDKAEEENGCTPLYIASQQGHKAVVVRLSEAGADKEKFGPAASSPLYIAAQNNRWDVVQYLCEVRASINHVTEYGCTPLYVAAQHGHCEVIKKLSSEGAEKDIANNNGTTPLFVATVQGHIEVVRLLCELGADRHKPNNDGITPEKAAENKGFDDLAKLLKT